MVSHWKKCVDDLQEELDRLTDVSEKNVNNDQTFLSETSQRLSRLLRADQTKDIANIINSNLVGTFMVGQGPVLQYTNARAREILGSDAEIRATLTSDNDVFYLADQVTICGDHLPWLRALTGKSVEGDLIFVRSTAASGYKWIKVCALPQRKADEDTVTSAIVMLIDTTEQIQAEHRLRQTRQALQQRLIDISSAQEALSLLNGKLGPKSIIAADADVASDNGSTAEPTQAASRSTKTRLALVADDLHVNRLLLSSQLHRLGFDVHLVNNGQEAVEAAAKNKYDMIFMDCDMPVMDGYMATEAIRSAEKQSNVHTPILAVTAYNRTGDREKCMAAGTDDYIPKGWDIVALHKMIESLLKDDNIVEIDGELLPGQESYNNSAEHVAQSSIPDLSTLEALYGKEKLDDIMALFITSAESLMDYIQASLTDRDAKAAHHFTYCLKGPSALLAPGIMAKLCEDIAESAIRGKWFDADDRFIELQAAFRSLRKSSQPGIVGDVRPKKDGSKSKASALSLNLFEQRVGKQTARAMAHAFKEDTHNIIEHMAASIRKYDYEQLHRDAHRLAGCCAAIYIADELHGLCKQLESHCNEEHVDWVEADKLFERLTKSYRETEALIATYLEAIEVV